MLCQWVLSWLLPRSGAALGVLLWEGAALSCSVGRALPVQGTQSRISQPGYSLPMGAVWHPVAGMTPTSQCSLEKQLGATRPCCCQVSPVQLSHSSCQAPHFPPPILHQELNICDSGPAKTLRLTATCPCRGKDRCMPRLSALPPNQQSLF